MEGGIRVMDEQKKCAIMARADARLCKSRFEMQIIVMVGVCFFGMIVLSVDTTWSLWVIGMVLGLCVATVIMVGLRIDDCIRADKLVKSVNVLKL